MKTCPHLEWLEKTLLSPKTIEWNRLAFNQVPCPWCAPQRELSIEEIAKLTKIEVDRFEEFNRIRDAFYQHTGWSGTYKFLISFAEDLLKTISELQHEVYFLKHKS